MIFRLLNKSRDEIKKKVNDVRKNNERLLNEGRFYEYHMNANFLRGLNYVLTRMRRNG